VSNKYLDVKHLKITLYKQKKRWYTLIERKEGKPYKPERTLK
jgi:hypothetical protein